MWLRIKEGISAYPHTKIWKSNHMTFLAVNMTCFFETISLAAILSLKQYWYASIAIGIHVLGKLFGR